MAVVHLLFFLLKICMLIYFLMKFFTLNSFRTLSRKSIYAQARASIIEQMIDLSLRSYHFMVILNFHIHPAKLSWSIAHPGHGTKTHDWARCFLSDIFSVVQARTKNLRASSRHTIFFL